MNFPQTFTSVRRWVAATICVISSFAAHNCSGAIITFDLNGIVTIANGTNFSANGVNAGDDLNVTVIFDDGAVDQNSSAILGKYALVGFEFTTDMNGSPFFIDILADPAALNSLIEISDGATDEWEASTGGSLFTPLSGTDFVLVTYGSTLTFLGADGNEISGDNLFEPNPEDFDSITFQFTRTVTNFIAGVVTSDTENLTGTFSTVPEGSPNMLLGILAIAFLRRRIA